MRTYLPLLLVAGACTQAPPEAPEGPPVYLALGDSIAFGYDPLAAVKHQVAGYPELLGQRMAIDVYNASCPGEASGGFMSPEGNDNNCRKNRSEYALHVAYTGTQLQYALDFLADNPNTELVTIDLGGNDISKLNDLCGGDLACVLGGFFPMLTEYGANLDRILGDLRKVYDGPLVGLGIYNPFPTDATAAFGLERLNAILADKLAEFDGVYADGMATFRDAATDPCAGGLLIEMPDGTCDIHPSPAGHELLADAIEAVLAH